MLRIIGAGLPRTGTRSLSEALRVLGFNTLHYTPQRLNLDRPRFKVYDDVDAVFDAPACFWWRELLLTYPASKIILTVRPEQAWWESVQRHVSTLNHRDDSAASRYAFRLHEILFGTVLPNEYIWRKRYREHNQLCRFVCTAPLLTLDISAANSRSIWEILCSFLDRPVPRVPFPWLNKSS